MRISHFVTPAIVGLVAFGCTEKKENIQNPVIDAGTSSVVVDPGLFSSAYIDPGLYSSAWIDPGFYSSAFIDPGLYSSAWIDPGLYSSAWVDPGLYSSAYVPGISSSNVIIPVSSATVLVSSSSATDPLTQQCGGLMPPKLSGGQNGWASRYWDCCKPSCSWHENTMAKNTPNGISKNCSINNTEMECFTGGTFQGTRSACEKDNPGPAYACYSQTPYAKCDKLAYGYAAVPGSSPQCGRCFQLDFNGGTNNNGGAKASHRALGGKTMIVMASNIGGDVSVGQFDIMIPGGGVGQFNACSDQWGVSNSQLGAQYGGLLTACQNEIKNYDAALDKFKTCVRNKCTAIFGNKPALADMLEGCNWYVDWFETADNPTFTYKEVKCPDELVTGYRSTFH